MKLKKLISLFITVIATLTLSACTITEGYGNGNSITLDVTIETVGGSQTNYSSLTEMLDAVRPTVYEVYGSDSALGGVSAGSGVAFATAKHNNVDYYYMLTCHHVIDGSDSITVKDVNGNEFYAGLIGGDKQADIAVLIFSPQVDGYTNHTVALAQIRLEKDSEYPLKVGEEVVAIGNPLGVLGGTVTKGIISATSRLLSVEGIAQPMNLIQMDCATNSGNSGGGLFDINGKLVGITNAGYSGYDGLNFAIPTDNALEIATSLMETYYYNSQADYNYGYVEGRYYAAAQYTPVPSFGTELGVYFTRINYATVYDCIVSHVSTGSAYAKAGLSLYDKIATVTFKGQTYSFSNGESLVNYLNSLSLSATDNTITLSVYKYNVLTGYESTLTNLTVTFEQHIYGNTFI